jgi:hypothetical protein
VRPQLQRPKRPQGFPHQHYPSNYRVKNKKLINIEGILMVRKYDEHINGAFLLQNFGGAGSLVVKSDIGADVLHELNLLFRTSGPDNLETLGFRYLDDKPKSRVRYMSFSHKRGKGDLRPDRTSACGNKDSLALME